MTHTFTEELEYPQDTPTNPFICISYCTTQFGSEEKGLEMRFWFLPQGIWNMNFVERKTRSKVTR